MSLTPPTSLRRADSRFLLPDWPRSARVLGDLPGWHHAFPFGTADDLPDRPADLVVAPAALAGVATAEKPASLLLPGRPTRGKWRTGYDVQAIVALPDIVDPRALVPRSHHRALSYVLSSWLPGTSHRSGLRNQGAALLARAGLLPPVLPEIAMATRQTASRAATRRAAPAVLAAAEAAGMVPPSARAQWFLGAQSGADSKRLVLFVLPEGSTKPTHLLKLDRRPGNSASADREAAGLELVRGVGGAVAARAPALLGRFETHGHPVLVQTSLPGSTLAQLLLGPQSRRDKTAVVDRVVSWLREVAIETASSAPGGQRRVFAHGDLAPGNVLVADGRFSVVDWEHAQAASSPLWDLLFFALHALPILDGVGEDPTENYLTRLFLGAAPASDLLFSWVEALGTDLALTEREVTELAGSCWEHYADHVDGLRRALVQSGAPTFPQLPVERLSQVWNRDPRFGRDWQPRRSAAAGGL